MCYGGVVIQDKSKRGSTNSPHQNNPSRDTKESPAYEPLKDFSATTDNKTDDEDLNEDESKNTKKLHSKVCCDSYGGQVDRKTYLVVISVS